MAPSSIKSQALISGATPVPNQNKGHKLWGTEKADRPAVQQTFAQVVANGSQTRGRSASQKSMSTDTGSSSSACGDSSPACSESPTSIPSFSEKEVPAPETQDSIPQPLSDLNGRICSSLAPLWVSNNSKGDMAAWLLVLPKLSQMNDISAANSSVQMPKSPNDAVLLGPYVTTKNTFLEESRVGGVLAIRQRSRAQSIGACCSGLP